MTGCDEIRLDLPAYLRRELPEERMSAIGTHLSRCAGCARELRELDEVAELAAMAPLEHDPLPQLESRVLGLIELDRDAAMHEEGAGRLPGRVASSLWGGWSRVAAVVTPALALLLIGLGAVSLGLRARTQELEERVERLQERLSPSVETLDSVTFSGSMQQGGWAVGKLVRNEDHDYRIVVRGEGLSPTPPGQHLELWLSGDDGWSSVGTFRVRDDGKVVLGFPVGVDLGNFSKLWVTAEPCDGNPARTGQDVLQASLSF